ncbi:alpha/beta hydrolase [Streptomyces sp. DSM 44917]|uniref:Alpha/beta hydrolase n=1 Tax=Streptomyces boetiae TaxID=3075541 RepID=A0ABU2L395_9ACTN|nr:alpha/beta hydrolase [Streptomyces sp. DSM 44917]MDT0306036.1 alpha/beta hydrolase [Streptomyces sp. DSM 44917]
MYERQLAAWGRGAAGGRALPDPEAEPARIARYFAGLTPAQRAGLAERYPLVVGNLPGAPLALRYRANRLAIEDARREERGRMRDERLSPAGRHEAGRRMHRLESMLRPERRFLAFDPTGRGRAAEVFGDLERAARISLVVPGADTELLTFERTRGRHTAPSGMARALYRQERVQRPGALRTAVIAWADYDAPDGLTMSAAIAAPAAAGAERLAEAVRALPGRVPVALFCHSYGSVVCGVAAPRLPGRITDIAVTGSPGMRAEDVNGLRTGARVWALRAEGDWIREVPHLAIGPLGHGADPAAPEFGAHVLSAAGSEGHSGYYEPGTESLRNLARVGAGEVEEVTCAPGAPSCAPFTRCAREGRARERPA